MLWRGEGRCEFRIRDLLPLPSLTTAVPRGIRSCYCRHDDIVDEDISRQDYEYDAPLQDYVDVAHKSHTVQAFDSYQCICKPEYGPIPFIYATGSDVDNRNTCCK